MKILGIVIPTHNRRLTVVRCVDALLQCRVPRDWLLRIVVVCDACTDTTAEDLRMSFTGRVAVLGHVSFGRPSQARNYGAAHLCNVGQRPDWLFFLDDDNILPPCALDRIINIIWAYPEVGIIGYYQKPEIETWVSKLEQWGQSLAGMCVPEKDVIIKEGQPFGCIFRTDDFEACSGYDPNLAMGEDVSLCFYIATLRKNTANYIFMNPHVVHAQVYDWRYLLSRAWGRGLNRKMPVEWPFFKLLLNITTLLTNTVTKIQRYRKTIKI